MIATRLEDEHSSVCIKSPGILCFVCVISAVSAPPATKAKMLRRMDKDIQNKLANIWKNTARGLLFRPSKLVKRIVSVFGSAAQPPREESSAAERLVVVPPPEPVDVAERPAFPRRSIVLSDTDNDVKSVKKTLRFAGILDQDGRWADNLKEITIFHTGDLIDKKNPDPDAAKYWQLLQRDARTRGCDVKLIVGNHEQVIWQKLAVGDKYGMDSTRAAWLHDFIEGMDLFYVAGPVLFIHGYPTLEFLRTLLHYKEVTGKDLNCFNTDHYKKAFRSVNAMRQYAYVKEKREANYLLYDVANASRYYRKQGRVVGAVLAQLEIEIVVHGHRPQRSGVQVDYEFDKWIPDVRMIGNDTVVRRRGIGATVINAKSSGALDIIFINTKTQSNKLRKKVRKDLRKQTDASSASRPVNSESPAIRSAGQA